MDGLYRNTWQVKWTEDDVRLLIKLCRPGPDGRRLDGDEIAAHFGGRFTKKAVYTKRARLGLVNSERAAKIRRTRGILQDKGVQWHEKRARESEAKFLADLAKHHPRGPLSVIEPPSKGLPYRPSPTCMNRSYITSPAAIAAE